MLIDTAFDVRSDTPAGRDPDSHSPTLRRYHRLLWSKTLPGGRSFHLSDAAAGVYLHHSSEMGEYFLSSDSVIPTFTRWPALKHITELFAEEENEAFRTIGYTIGGMMVFPGNRIDGGWTINQARGMLYQKIADRMDLTLECIRRHYLEEASPLGDTLARYSDFFALFEHFPGYVDFFLLQDLVNENSDAIKFLMPFDDFKRASTPRNRDEYIAYRHQTIAFINARNRRIERYAGEVVSA